MKPLSEPSHAHPPSRVESHGEQRAGVPLLILTSMRPYQWIKNLFVLAPLMFGQKLGDPVAIAYAVLAFFTFCFMSSAVYIINDLTDAKADRFHPTKRLRPIASGALSTSTSLMTVAGLMLLAMSGAGVIGVQFSLIAGSYLAMTLWYCFSLKNVFLVDAMVIALGFVMRVSNGAVAIDVQITHWLIVCTFLLALYLAFSKRRNELQNLAGHASEHRSVLGQYTEGYLEQVNVIVMGATIVCYALYTVAPETVSSFGTDKLIYGTVFVLYGLFRYMALTIHSEHGGDPSRLLWKDKPLLLSIVSWAGYNAMIIYYGRLSQLWVNLGEGLLSLGP